MENKLMDIVLKILISISKKLGEDSIVLDIKNITSICDYFIITSASSTRQVKAIVDEIEEKLKEEDVELFSKEGYDQGRWVLLDYGDIIVHVFHEEDRKFYNLEGVWKDATKVDLDIS